MSSFSSKLYGGLVCCAYKCFFCLVDLPLTSLCNIVHLFRVPPTSALEILVPANAVGKVMGKGGANLANIRKVDSFLSLSLSVLHSCTVKMRLITFSHNLLQRLFS